MTAVESMRLYYRHWGFGAQLAKLATLTSLFHRGNTHPLSDYSFARAASIFRGC